MEGEDAILRHEETAMPSMQSYTASDRRERPAIGIPGIGLRADGCGCVHDNGEFNAIMPLEMPYMPRYLDKHAIIQNIETTWGNPIMPILLRKEGTEGV